MLVTFKKLIIVIVAAIIISTSSAYLILDYTFTTQQNYNVHNDPFVKNCVPTDDKVVLMTIGIENKTHTFDLRNCEWNLK